VLPDAARARNSVAAIAARLPVSNPDITVGPVLTREDRVLLIARTNPLACRARC